RAIGSLHLGYNRDGELVYAGKVGTGFSMKEAERLYEALHPARTAKAPVPHVPRDAQRGANWVNPELLCEAGFTEWTSEGRIRHPVYHGLRVDKKPREVVREEPVDADSKKATKPKKARKSEKTLELRGVAISHPDRVIFPDTGMTKVELAAYYDAIEPLILADIKNHPVSLIRCPGGLEEDCFFQRSPGRGWGGDIKPFRWKHKGKMYEY